MSAATSSPASGSKHERRREVDRDAGERDPEHDAAVHGRRRGEPARGRVHDEEADDEQRDAVSLRGEDLAAAEPERPRPARGMRRDVRRDQCGGERGRVGEHVAGIGEQRERAGEERGHDFAHHERDDQRERDRDRAAVVRAVSVRVRVQGAPAASGG
jgi:hypothetical protein